MSTINLDDLANFITQAQKLQDVLQDIVPYIEVIKQQVPNDRLIRAGEAAWILGVSKSKIGQYVKAGLLKPYYTDSEFQKFWLSEVKALPRQQQWTLEELSS